MITLQGARPLLLSALLGVVGAVGMALGLAVNAHRAWLSYLVAYTYAVSIAVGALIFLMIGYAANASWVAPIRRLNEMVALAVLPLALLFVPLLWGLSPLYPWVDPHPGMSEHLRHLIEHKEPYLNVPFFALRAAFYFVVWGGAALLLWRWSLRRDGRAQKKDGDDLPVDPAKVIRRERALSAVGLILTALTITMAAFDWLMSMQPEWFSTMFGVYYFAGGFLGAFALLGLLAARARATSLSEVISEHHFHALGRLLFAFVIFWAYSGYFQLFLISIADKPEEVTFYLKRSGEGWNWLVATLILGHFALPFALLLPRAPKKKPRFVAAVSAWLLLMHLADVYWMVMPAHDHSRAGALWIQLSALLLVLGASVATVLAMSRGKSILATGDPMLPAGVRYRSPL